MAKNMVQYLHFRILEFPLTNPLIFGPPASALSPASNATADSRAARLAQGAVSTALTPWPWMVGTWYSRDVEIHYSLMVHGTSWYME